MGSKHAYPEPRGEGTHGPAPYTVAIGGTVFETHPVGGCFLAYKRTDEHAPRATREFPPCSPAEQEYTEWAWTRWRAEDDTIFDLRDGTSEGSLRVDRLSLRDNVPATWTAEGGTLTFSPGTGYRSLTRDGCKATVVKESGETLTAKRTFPACPSG